MSTLDLNDLDRPGADPGLTRSGSRSLAAALRRAERGDRVRSLLLAAPLLLLLAVSFGIPIVLLLSRAVYDPTIADALPRTSAALDGWDRKGLPSDQAFTALAEDFKENQANGTAYELAKSLNARLPGARSQVLKTVRKLEGAGDTPALEIVKSVPFWSQPATWVTIEIGTHILGFPLAYLMANAPKGLAAILIIAVLLPFWTSILVRTAAWTVLLQKFGLINDLLLWLGVTHDRLDLMYTRIGLIVAMTHIQLPFTLLPIYSVMRTIPPSQMRAA